MATNTNDKALQQLLNISGKKVDMKLLWENASPTSTLSTFAKQKITLDLTEYSAFVIIIRHSTGSPGQSSQLIMDKDASHYVSLVNAAGAGGYIQNRYRVFTCSNDEVIAGDAWFGRSDTGEKIDNSVAIPTSIYGIKGVKK